MYFKARDRVGRTRRASSERVVFTGCRDAGAWSLVGILGASNNPFGWRVGRPRNLGRKRQPSRWTRRVLTLSVDAQGEEKEAAASTFAGLEP